MSAAAPTPRIVTCRRCRGKGVVDRAPVYAGLPGGCYRCAGRGEHYASPFHQRFGATGRIFGVTERRYLNPGNPNNGVFKSLLGENEINNPDLTLDGSEQPCWGGTIRFTELSADAAFRFFQRLAGLRHLRVGDVEGPIVPLRR